MAISVSNKVIKISRLSHTWLIDIDGTVVLHNGHKSGVDVLLPGVEAFWAKIPAEDIVILLTARTEVESEQLLLLLKEKGLRVDRVLFGLPHGERILLNDIKPRGLATAIAVNVQRDSGLEPYIFEIEDSI